MKNPGRLRHIVPGIAVGWLALLPGACSDGASAGPPAAARAFHLDDDGDRETFDYVIAGGGTAGCVLARRLSEDPKNRVLLLEAGPTLSSGTEALKSSLRNTLAVWEDPEVTVAMTTEPSPGTGNRPTSVLLGQGLGGTTNINGGFYGRPLLSEFDEWGVPGWRGRDVLPYFLRLEDHDLHVPGDLHGTGGPVHAGFPGRQQTLTPFYLGLGAQAGVALVPDLSNAVDENGLSPALVASRKGTGQRLDSYTAYLAPVVPRRNLVLRTSAPVVRVEGGDEGDKGDDDGPRRITRVSYMNDGAPASVKVRREVILSAGVFNSPKILLQSGIGPADELRALKIRVRRDVPGVGRNLIMRPMVTSVYSGIPGVLFPEIDPNQLATDPTLLNVPVLGVLGSQKSDPRLAHPDYLLFFNDVLPPLPPQFNGVTSPSLGVCLLGPVRSRGRVTLASSNPRDRPRIEPNLLGDPADALPLVACLKRIREIAAAQPQLQSSPPFLGVELVPGAAAQSDQDILGYVIGTADDSYHSFGTCKLGDVVDRRLRVRGFRNLRVADGSIIPQSLRAEPMSTTYMIGEYASQMILDDNPRDDR